MKVSLQEGMGSRDPAVFPFVAKYQSMKVLLLEVSRGFRRAMIFSWWLVALAIASVPLAAQTCPRDRAMWIYQCPYDVARDPAERDALFPFAVRQGIREFFLRVSVQCESSPDPLGFTCTLGDASYRENLRLFNLKAHHRNIRVHALFDDYTLALTSEHNRARAIVRAMIAFNNRTQAVYRFDGIHFDVEPHALTTRPHDEYLIDRIGTLRQFLDMNAAVVEELAASDLSYGVDVPDNWYPFVDENGIYQERRNFLMEYRGRTDYPTMHLMDMVKQIAIMSYHRNPNTTIRKTDYAIAYAADVGAAVYVGVQTSPRLPDQRCVGQRARACSETFGVGCSTRSEMEGALCTIENAFAGYDSFLGFAYFKYSSYRDMRETPE